MDPNAATAALGSEDKLESDFQTAHQPCARYFACKGFSPHACLVTAGRYVVRTATSGRLVRATAFASVSDSNCRALTPIFVPSIHYQAPCQETYGTTNSSALTYVVMLALIKLSPGNSCQLLTLMAKKKAPKNSPGTCGIDAGPL